MKNLPCRCLVLVLSALGLRAASVHAAVAPKETPLAEKAFHNAAFYPRDVQQSLKDLPELAAGLAPDLAALGAAPESALYDPRTGRWTSLVLSVPLIPGTGDGNRLTWEEVTGNPSPDDAAMQDAVWGAMRAYLQQHTAQLRVSLAELAAPRITIAEKGSLVFVWSQRTMGGVPVRDSGFTAVLNHGNLVLLGLQNWAEADSPGAPSLSAEDARAVLSRHLSPHAVEAFKRGQRLELIPMMGEGRIELRLAWVVPVKMRNDPGSWEGLVDAGSGELLAFEDKNVYTARKVVGGVYPVSNDQRPPDGQEQAGWPMPYADVVVGGNTLFTTTGGTFGCPAGSAQTTLAGSFIRMVDTCGAINETGAGNLDLGTSGGTDCTVPSGHSAGDTHSSRSGFYELNRIKEQARGYLPGNAWLQAQLTANMNLNMTCNAFWNGSSVNFFKDSGSACRNTGEIAAIFDHEWGHGLDNNGTNPNISGPGEAIADIHAMMRLATSCVGRGFFKNQVCGGYGDACDGTPTDGCTGVRDLDFLNHRCNQPHTITWALSGFTGAQCGGAPAPACPAGSGTPCNRETHCEGYVAAETGWDLYARDLQAPPFSFDANTALELAGRLSFLGSEAITNWYTCSVGGGCGATNGYMLFLAADDDDGNLANGTPHMSAIRAAFERHQIHCATPPVANTGCAGGPTTAPVVTATATDAGVNLSWGAVAGAARYNVYRTEGVAACNFGKIKIGETTGTSFSDVGLLNGRPYSYMVLPVGSNTSCFGLASACTTATPVPGPNLGISTAITVTLSGGDGDEFLDNCESATVQFSVENTGTGTLTNVRLVAVTPLTHPATVVNTPLPAPIAGSLGDCTTASGSFNITAQGMGPNETTQIQIEATADEIFPATRTQIVSIANVESDWINVPTRTFHFDTNLEGWTVTSGTFTRQPGGANGSPFHVSSSENLDDQCDVIRSPVVKLAANSTLSLFNRYDIEPAVPTPYDRANVGVVDLQTGTRTVVSPSSGQLYTLPSGAPNGVCGTEGQAGWNGQSPGYPAFNVSNWTAAAFNPGGVFTNKRTQLEIRYGTDPGDARLGFDFDEVTLTNFAILGPDAQSDICLANGSLTGTVTDSLTTNPISGALVQTGIFSGTTNGSGVYLINLPPGTYDVTASDPGYIPSTASGVVVNPAATTTQDFALNPCPTITVSPSTLPPGTAGSPYSQTFTQTGGLAPITWSLTGALPTGITFNTSTGVLSGTPVQIGSFPLTVTATDANACTGGVSVTLVINAAGPFRPTALVVDSIGNSVLEAGETVGVVPTWRNDTGIPQAITGAFSAFTGPGDPNPTYTIVDGAADYGTVAAGASASCSTNCYVLALGTPSSRPVQHWDATVLETLSSGETKSWKLHVGESFTDVPRSSGFYRFIETLLHKGVTGGCGTNIYCPSTATTREQMAAFVLLAKEGMGYSPAACAPPNVFGDVPESSPFCRFIEELSNRGVVSGCGGGNYCPTSPVTREQMAVFVLRTLDPALNPPACGTPVFGDVPASSPFCKWIEELARRGVVSGCGGGNYCPTNPVTREQMGVFLGATFSLTLYGP